MSWMNNSAIQMKEAVKSTSCLNNLASLMKMAMKLDELKNNSASRMSFSQGYGCVYTRRVARRKLDGWP